MKQKDLYINKYDENGHTQLTRACWDGDIDRVKLLIDVEGIDLELPTKKHGWGPLLIALHGAEFEIADILLHAGADPNSSLLIPSEIDPNITTVMENSNLVPLHVACGLFKEFKHTIPDIVESLIKFGANVDALDEFGEPILSSICQDKNVILAKLLISGGAYLNILNSEGLKPLDYFYISNQYGSLKELLLTALVYKYFKEYRLEQSGNELYKFASTKLNLERLVTLEGAKQKALEFQKNLEHIDYEELSKTINSILNGNKILDAQEIRVVIEKELLKKIDLGNTELHQACIDKNFIKVKEILKADQVDINAKNLDGNTAFFLACQIGYDYIVNMLVSAKADMNIKGGNGNTPIIEAFKNSNRETVLKLIKAGADLDMVDNDGQTLLMLTYNDDFKIDIFYALLKCGVDLNIKDNKGESALLKVINNGDRVFAKSLIEAGAFIDIEFDGKPLLIYLTSRYSSEYWLECLESAIKAGADINIIDKNGNNALFEPCKLGNIAVIKTLILHGIDFTKTNKEHKKAFDLLPENNNLEILKEILPLIAVSKFCQEYSSELSNSIWCFNELTTKLPKPLLLNIITEANFDKLQKLDLSNIVTNNDVSLSIKDLQSKLSFSEICSAFYKFTQYPKKIDSEEISSDLIMPLDEASHNENDLLGDIMYDQYDD